MTAEETITAIRDAFRDVQRPEGLFVRGTCLCSECEEHDRTLASHDPDNITLTELGNAGWDPMCFASDQAFAYYIPAMVRLAFEDPFYMDQLMFHLTVPGRADSFSREHAAALLSSLWSWAEHCLEQVSADWNITGQIHQFEEAIRRLEAAANGGHYPPS